jgi:hypothetical protein
MESAESAKESATCASERSERFKNISVMKLISWENRQPGDVGLVRIENLMGGLIADFVSEIHEDYRGGFVPTHAFVMAPGDMVIESALTWNEDSVAAINPASQYAEMPAQLWRVERSAVQINAALGAFMTEYAGDGYGVMNLLGFAIEAMMRHLGNPKARNPILLSYVCSQAALLFLRYPAAEKWPLKADLRDCDPLALLMLCEAHRESF